MLACDTTLAADRYILYGIFVENCQDAAPRSGVVAVALRTHAEVTVGESSLLADQRPATGSYEPATSLTLAAWYNHSHTKCMKTAISIPDSIFEEAERLAKTRGWSRSELYANAVTAYVNSERFSGVREKLDAVYGGDAEDSAIDPLLVKAQGGSLPREKW